MPLSRMFSPCRRSTRADAQSLTKRSPCTDCTRCLRDIGRPGPTPWHPPTAARQDKIPLARVARRLTISSVTSSPRNGNHIVASRRIAWATSCPRAESFDNRGPREYRKTASPQPTREPHPGSAETFSHNATRSQSGDRQMPRNLLLQRGGRQNERPRINRLRVQAADPASSPSSAQALSSLRLPPRWPRPQGLAIFAPPPGPDRSESRRWTVFAPNRARAAWADAVWSCPVASSIR
jgi:hypothetical protein